MNAQHTPGPWTIQQQGPDEQIYVIQEDGMRFICRMEECYSEQNANANLIAAAPDLLTSLQRLYDATYGKTDLVCPLDFEHARKAIGKAKGPQ